MSKVKMNKPILNVPLFVVVNTDEMLFEGYNDEINTVVLNSLDPSEFIDILTKEKNRSINYHYWLAFANNIEGIEGLRKLASFMEKEGFKYIITDSQMRMYINTLKDRGELVA
ncbi:hypothetical protein [Cellulosilyticum sp. I15G10I2]|uniref:hypothetical protein n=1 Tax=Cellulosilyticum sp. I15G10I2 TaxID=1892843 RepID=UPI00085CA6BA|nr:hypothetical protein [Cellulosilyticum sp. I15G10I2]